MGQVQDIIRKSMVKKRVKVFIAGNPTSGKTMILYRWKKQILNHTTPTIGYNVERVIRNKIELELWEGGGSSNFRKLWFHQMEKVEALVIVVDQNDLLQDQDYLQNKIKELLPLLPQKDLPFLILANKMDLKQSTDQEIEDYVGVEQYRQQIKSHIIHTNALTGEGVKEALNWLFLQFK